MKKKLSTRQIVINEIPYLLLHFLIRDETLNKFCNNVVKEFSEVDPNDIPLKEYLSSKGVRESPIQFTFTWVNSPEGYNFWYRRHLEYKRLKEALTNN